MAPVFKSCKALADLTQAAVIQYQLKLSAAGMMPSAFGQTRPAAEGLEALAAYERAWRQSTFSEDTLLRAEGSGPPFPELEVLPCTGGFVPVDCGERGIALVRPESTARGVTHEKRVVMNQSLHIPFVCQVAVDSHSDLIALVGHSEEPQYPPR